MSIPVSCTLFTMHILHDLPVLHFPVGDFPQTLLEHVFPYETICCRVEGLSASSQISCIMSFKDAGDRFNKFILILRLHTCSANKSQLTSQIYLPTFSVP